MAHAQNIFSVNPSPSEFTKQFTEHWFILLCFIRIASLLHFFKVLWVWFGFIPKTHLRGTTIPKRHCRNMHAQKLATIEILYLMRQRSPRSQRIYGYISKLEVSGSSSIFSFTALMRIHYLILVVLSVSPGTAFMIRKITATVFLKLCHYTCERFQIFFLSCCYKMLSEWIGEGGSSLLSQPILKIKGGNLPDMMLWWQLTSPYPLPQLHGGWVASWSFT